MAATEPAVSSLDYRRTLAEFASGVTVITGGTQDSPVGFACQSFSALSLDPALVLFCVDRQSRSWPILRESGRFCANILSEDQHGMVKAFGSRAGQKFNEVDWTWSVWSTPSLPNVLARIHATITSVYSEGDHDIIVGQVNALERVGTLRRPMVFFRGTFDIDTQATDAFNAWSLMGGWI